MNSTLSLGDFASLSPLLILLTSGLILLLLESFEEKAAKRFSAMITLTALVMAIGAAFYAPASENPLLSHWLRFDLVAKFFTIFFLSIGIATTLLAASFFQRFNLETAVKDDKVMLDFDSESFVIGGDHPPKVKAPPITNDNGSKDCVNLSSSTAVSRFNATHGEYYFLLLSSLFGLILIGASADFLTLFIGLETLSIALYILCGYMKNWKFSHEAAIKYFLIGALSAAFLLYGIALVYGAVGTTRFEGLLSGYKAISSSSNHVLFLSGIALITLGIAFKAAIVPFHQWAPDVYDGAPTPVTAFMAVATKVGAFAAFVRIFMVALPEFNPLWNQGISWLAFPTLIYANFVALRQVQLRRFFAYSGISHAGFLLIPLAAGTHDALSALLFYLVIYALATLGAFSVLAFLDNKSEGVVLDDLKGLFQRSPLLAAVFSICLLTLAGIPPTAGFFAKFYVFKVGFEAGYYALVIVALLTTILSAFYYMRFVAAMFSANSKGQSVTSPSWPAAVVGIISVAAIGVLSCYPAPLLKVVAALSFGH